MADPIKENWKPVVNYEGLYEVSDLGRVRSLDRYVPHPNRWKSRGFRKVRGRMLSAKINSKGYVAVQLNKGGRAWDVESHVLVLLAFVGPRPPGMQACHNDGDPSNPHLSNLRWDTPSANNMDKRKHGTAQHGSRNGNSKLTENAVREIRKRFQVGATAPALAKVYGIHPGTVYSIVYGRVWRHV